MWQCHLGPRCPICRQNWTWRRCSATVTRIATPLQRASRTRTSRSSSWLRTCPATELLFKVSFYIHIRKYDNLLSHLIFLYLTGERFQGVDSSLDELLLAGTRAGQRALEQSNALPLPDAAVAELSLRALRQVSLSASSACILYIVLCKLCISYLYCFAAIYVVSSIPGCR